MTLVDVDKFLSYLIYSKHIDGLTCGEVKEAIEMCKVNVLNASVEDEDCISRKELIEKARQGGLVGNRNFESVCKWINSLPPVTPKERTGEWIEDEEQNHVEKTWHCSECGNTAWGSYEKTTYCCQCGARMKKGEENE